MNQAIREEAKERGIPREEARKNVEAYHQALSELAKGDHHNHNDEIENG